MSPNLTLTIWFHVCSESLRNKVSRAGRYSVHTLLAGAVVMLHVVSARAVSTAGVNLGTNLDVQ